MATKKKLAVFDIDGTIFRSSFLVELLEALIAEGIVPSKARKQYERAWKKWQSRAGTAESGYSYYEFIHGVVEAYQRYIAGVRRADVWRVAEKVVKFQRVRLYRFTRDLIKKLKRTHFLLAISHSPFEVVSPFAKSIGFDKVYAVVYEVDDKVRFTGRVLYQDVILDKGKTLRRAIEKEGLTLKGSIGVGDTESDIPFLSMVSYPVAFNPSLKLYRYAARAGWEVVVERKDVIYRFKPGGGKGILRFLS